MTPMDRLPLEEQISALLDDELEANERAELERRIAQDSEVRSVYEVMKRTVSLVRDLPRESAPSNMAEASLMRAERYRPGTKSASDRQTLRWTSWLGVAAAFGLITFLTWQGVSSRKEGQFALHKSPSTEKDVEASLRSKQESQSFAEEDRTQVLADRSDTTQTGLGYSDLDDQKDAEQLGAKLKKDAEGDEVSSPVGGQSAIREERALAPGEPNQPAAAAMGIAAESMPSPAPTAELVYVFRDNRTRDLATMELNNLVFENWQAGPELRTRGTTGRARVLPTTPENPVNIANQLRNAVVELPPEDVPILLDDLADQDGPQLASVELQIGSNSIRGREAIHHFLQSNVDQKEIESSELAEPASSQRQVDIPPVQAGKGGGGKGGRGRAGGRDADGSEGDAAKPARIAEKKGVMPPSDIEGEAMADPCSKLSAEQCELLFKALAEWLGQESVTLNVVFTTEEELFNTARGDVENVNQNESPVSDEKAGDVPEKDDSQPPSN